MRSERLDPIDLTRYLKTESADVSKFESSDQNSVDRPNTFDVSRISGNKSIIFEKQKNMLEKILHGQSESELHKHFGSCWKNAGHTGFIAINIFTLNHLPDGYKHLDILELTKSLADLTVKVGVQMTSSQRPKFFPDTNQCYPFYDKRGTTHFTSGSGLIYDLTHYKSKQTPCICSHCRCSDRPSTEWFKLYVFTTSHLLFDEIEAQHTCLILFYDSEESECVRIDTVFIIKSCIMEDVTLLTAVTCAKNIGENLQKMLRYNKDLVEKTFQRYFLEDIKLSIIISHPHGCSKYVSVGEVKNHYLVGRFNSMLTYTTPTCQGSSGALVYLINSKKVYFHVGWNNDKLQYSQFGFTM